MAAVGRLLERHRSLRMAEILSVFLVAGAVTVPGWRLVGPNPFARQVVVWVANVLMLLVVWLGLRARGQGWEHFGLRFRFAGWGALGRTVLRSLMVLIAALGAFVVAAIVMRNIQGAAGAAAPGRYNYLQGNLPLLLLALVAVYIVSSFGEEVLYRGFLINRIAELGGRGRFAWTLGAVSSAAIFGLAHFD